MVTLVHSGLAQKALEDVATRRDERGLHAPTESFPRVLRSSDEDADADHYFIALRYEGEEGATSAVSRVGTVIAGHRTVNVADGYTMTDLELVIELVADASAILSPRELELGY
jgi:hypothetical protein